MGIKVSVIIAVYNCEMYIETCLQSVLHQTFQNYEMVLVNDGSTDCSPEILAIYQKKHPDKIKIINKKNGGLSSARNVGLGVAEGVFVTFLDSDDYLEEHYLEILVNTIESKNCDVVCSGQYKVKESGEIVDTITYKPENGKCLMRRLNISGKIYRTQYIQKCNISFPIGKVYEDNSFNLQALFLSDKNFFLDYVGYYQVVHEGSITSRPIVMDALPLGDWRNCIQRVLENHDGSIDRDLFEFTVLSFFTYFLLVRNRKREYLGNIAGNKIVKIKNVLQIADFFQDTVNCFFPNARKNKYAVIGKYKEFGIAQRMGVKVFAWLCYLKKARNFTKIFYKMLG